MQSQKGSLIEAISGTSIGLITSFIISVITYPLLGIEVSLGENLILTGIFFIVSIIRSYFVRRLFNKIFKKDEDK